jgi:hypothetical protein
MLRQLIVFGCLAAAGCGSSAVAPPDADPILGSWLVAVGASCAWGFTFEQAAYVEAIVCVASDSTNQLDEDKGSWFDDGTTLFLTPNMSSCATSPATATPYTVTPSQLTLTAPSSVSVFARIVPSGSATATFGCFNAGVFTPSPLAPI